MLDSARTVLNQITIMFLLMLVGHVLYRRKIIDDQGSKQISALLLNIVTPAVIITSFQRPFSWGDAKLLGSAFFFALLTYVAPLALSRLLYGRSKQPWAKDAQMCIIFSNNGFMAIPLLQALLGSTGVFLGSAGIVTGTVIAWTYGARMLSGQQKIDLKKIFLNPGTVALFLGLALFFSPFKLPGPIFQAVNYLGSLNTPLAMLVLGVYLSQAQVLSCLRDKTVYLISFLKLLVVPLVAMGLLWVLGADATLASALLIGIAAPTAIIAAMMAQMFGTDHLFSTRIVAVTTLLSAVTLPLFVLLPQLLWGIS